MKNQSRILTYSICEVLQKWIGKAYKSSLKKEAMDGYNYIYMSINSY